MTNQQTTKIPVRRRRKLQPLKGIDHAIVRTSKKPIKAFSQEPDEIEKIGNTVLSLMSRIFLNNESISLSTQSQKTLLKLSETGVDFSELIRHIEKRDFTPQQLEALLKPYANIGLRKMDGSAVRIPSRQELMIEANNILLQDFQKRDVDKFTPEQERLLNALIQSGFSLFDFLKLLSSKKEHTLLLLTLASYSLNTDEIPQEMKIIDFLSTPPVEQGPDAGDPTTERYLNKLLKEAKTQALALPKQLALKAHVSFCQQLKSMEYLSSKGETAQQFRRRLRGCRINRA